MSLSDFGSRLDVGYPGGRAVLASGTSLATGRTAAVAAMLRAQRPELTAPEIRALLEATASPFADSSSEVKHFGTGVTNLDQALKTILQ